MLILGRTLARGCRYVTTWCDLELSFHLAVVTMTLKILSGLFLRICKVYEVDIW